MHAPASVQRGQVLTVAQVVGVTVLPTAHRAAISVKTAALVWAMRLSVLSAKPWSAPKCPCANWPRKPMAKR
jgi:hypothetical protein